MLFPKGEPGELGEQGPKGERGSEVSRKQENKTALNWNLYVFPVH